MTGRKEHHVFLTLRRGLLLGKWLPASRLRPAELAVELGVSASPVREALTRLAERGLVTNTDHLGFAVAPLDPLVARHYCSILSRLYTDSIDHLAAAGLLSDVADKIAPAVATHEIAHDAADAYLRASDACLRLLLITPYQDLAERLGDIVAAHAAQSGADQFYTSSLRELAALLPALRQGGAVPLRRAIRIYFKRRSSEITQAIARRAGLPMSPNAGRDLLSR